ncbi:MAG: Gfo/Idh/MocA family protein, partial [Planctomycetota bacterium]
MQRVRMAMVGGRPGKFICDAHHMAWRLDGLIDLVAGAFSRDAAQNAAAGAQLGVAPERVYDDWRAMLQAEAARPAAERVELVASITPNRLHVPVIAAALEHGFPVISDKPLGYGLAEADDLHRRAAAADVPTAITYTYSAYPMVQAARELIAAGELGAVRKAVAEYQQGGVAAGLASGDADRLERLRT